MSTNNVRDQLPANQPPAALLPVRMVCVVGVGIPRRKG